MYLRLSQKHSAAAAHLAAALGSILAAIVMTWPLAPHAQDHVLGAIYHWDAYTNAMILGARVDAALRLAPLGLYDNYFFAPLPDSIVFNENHFGLALLFAPFYLAGNNPLLAYNLTLLTSLSLAVFFTYLLVRRLTRSGYAGFLAGVTFAFCPYVAFELGRIQLVATQWIPASFYFLHRAWDGKRLRDVAAFWFVYALQIGTCLYYAMFLIPLLAVSSVWLFARANPTRRFLLQFVGAGLAAGCLALAMVYPYFAARHSFDLERALSFAASYDGALEFLGNVHPTNRTLTALHHLPRLPGAHEEIAFPGVTVVGLGMLSLARAITVGSRRLAQGSLAKSQLMFLVTRAGLAAGLATVSMLLTHSMLVGVIVGVWASWWHFHEQTFMPRSTTRELYLLLAAVALLMFLGLYPFAFRDRNVLGLYYYFHTYFPGFNGIRKVSRQAITFTFALCVFGSFGAAWLFSLINRSSFFSRSSLFKRRAARWALLVGLLTMAGWELRVFPHPLVQAWAGRGVPRAYSFLERLPASDLLVTLPQDEGKARFRGDDGMAYHNYLALYHKHRIISGQSSWMPQVTELVRRSLLELPDPSATRVLGMVGARHILIHGGDLRPERLGLVDRLSSQPKLYRRVFQDGQDSIFSLVATAEPTMELLPTPGLPSAARPVELRGSRPASNWETQRLHFALDGRLDTHWSTRRPQRSGHHFEVLLEQPRHVVALEIHNPGHEMYLPLSYTVSTALENGNLAPVAQQRQLRLFSDQVYAPKAFVYRIVLPRPILADRVRLSVDQPLPGYDFVIHEFRLFESPEP